MFNSNRTTVFPVSVTIEKDDSSKLIHIHNTTNKSMWDKIQ